MTPGRRRVLWFGLAFLPLFALSLFLYPKILAPYERLVLAVASPALARLSPPLEVKVGDRGEMDAYAVEYDGGRRPIFGQSYRPHVIYMNLLLLPALLLATPGPSVKRFRRLLVGLGLLFVLHVVTIVVLLQSYQCLLKDPSDFPCFCIHGLALTSGQILAVAGWALLTWSEWFPRRAADSAPGGVRAGRNQDCPCGSGLKYKRCCGASTG